MTACEASISVTWASVRPTMNRCRSGLIARSCRVISAQEGTVRNASLTVASETAFTLAGRCTIARRVHDDFASRAATAEKTAEDPSDVLRTIGNNITAQLLDPDVRGCAFINAASEFEDPHGPIMRAVLAHRAWFHGLVREAFASAGHPQPDLAASHYVMLRDGATTAGHLGDPVQARDTFDRALAGLLAFIDGSAGTDGATADPKSSDVSWTSSRTSARVRSPEPSAGT